jgi:hypothetical protein
MSRRTIYDFIILKQINDRLPPPIDWVGDSEVIQCSIAPALCLVEHSQSVLRDQQDLHGFAGIAGHNGKFCAVLQYVVDHFRDVVVDPNPIGMISGD